VVWALSLMAATPGPLAEMFGSPTMAMAGAPFLLASVVGSFLIGQR
jgi:hypothetical protein